MIKSDLSNLQECCDAPKPSHWEDCPVWRGYWYHPEPEAQP